MCGLFETKSWVGRSKTPYNIDDGRTSKNGNMMKSWIQNSSFYSKEQSQATNFLDNWATCFVYFTSFTESFFSCSTHGVEVILMLHLQHQPNCREALSHAMNVTSKIPGPVSLTRFQARLFWHGDGLPHKLQGFMTLWNGQRGTFVFVLILRRRVPYNCPAMYSTLLLL